MAKTKTPFFGLGSSGTIGGVLTSQKRGSATLLRDKPVPTDPYSLAQAYQRWDYRDYAYRWTLLSDSEKQVYRTASSKYHITGFSLWMRENLKALTNLVGRWHLDEKSGAVAHDSSRNLHHGAIIGASPTGGLIDGALYFDGLNDKVTISHIDAYNITEELTILAFINTPDHTNFRSIIGKNALGHGWFEPFYLTLVQGNGFLFGRIGDGLGQDTITGNVDLTGAWHAVCFKYDADFLYLLVDGVQHVAPVARTRDPITNTTDITIGSWWTARMLGEIDNVELHDHALTTTEIKRHAERRYPP